MLKPIFVRQNKTLKKIDPLDVMFICTEENYTRLFLADDTHYLIRSTMTRAMKKLPPDIFIRTERSYAVSVFYIDNIAKDHLTVSEHTIPISRQYYNNLIAQLQIID
jgi:DNA-binding LytR/AlgR family response regulator